MADQTLHDPLSRRVRFTDKTWDIHILEGHPEMAPFRAAAHSAITSPIQINNSTSDPRCRLYYGKCPRAGLMICVVADIRRGFVKTAYLCKRIKPGSQEWP